MIPRSSSALVMRLFPLLLLLLLFLFLLLPSSLAVGVSPGRIDFGEVLPGGYAEASLMVSNPRDEPLVVDIISPRWVAVSEMSFELAPLEHRKISIVLAPPDDAMLGPVDGRIKITSRASASSPGTRAGISLSLGVPISFSIVDAPAPECLLGGLTFNPVESTDPISFVFTVKNTGNTRIVPSGTLDILQDGMLIKTSTLEFEEETLPTTTKEYVASSASLPEGEYEALVTTQCGLAHGSFAVSAPGSLRSSGTLTSLVVQDGKAVARFENTGNRSVTARFTGVIEKKGKILRVIESETLLVAPGQVVDLEAFMSSGIDGELHGSVMYEGLSSEELIVPVIKEGGGEGVDYGFYVIVALVLFAVILLILIVERKRR